MTAGIFLILDIQAAEKRADVIRIPVRQIDSRLIALGERVRIELEGVALDAVFLIRDRLLIFAFAVLFMAIGAAQLPRHITGFQMDRVIEFQRVHVLHVIP